jgi:hypothetical protein
VCIVLSLTIGGMPMSSVGLAIGGMPMSSVGLGYRWDACERWSILAIGVTPVGLWPFLTTSNLGVVPCLLVI